MLIRMEPIRNSRDPHAWNTNACEGPLLQTSLHMASSGKWYLHVGEWPRMPLASFYIVLDRFLNTLPHLSFSERLILGSSSI